MIWTPHVTVAAVVEHAGRYLLVEERSDGRVVFNQPAGHLDPNESLVDAVIREVREETGRVFVPEALVGVYLWTHPAGETFLRVAFCGTVGERLPGSTLDTEIIDARWFGMDEIEALRAQHRSPLVARCIADHRAGVRYPLAMLQRLLPDGRDA
ncbi:MAG: NUDIX hydrolase [Rhodocyclaceae bacterium]|nr:NUDIX hydrolase [Rhodocyclaceae bacterium]